MSSLGTVKKERSDDQRVEAFSAPTALLDLALKRATALGMTRSGYYRYCLALELGHSPEQAKQIAGFMPLARANGSLDALSRKQELSPDGTNLEPPGAAKRLLKKGAASALKPASK